MNYIKCFILLCTLQAINNFGSDTSGDTRYYELKERYKKQQKDSTLTNPITPQEEKELAAMAAQRRISRYISNPHGDPALIALHLRTILAHPFYKNLCTVQVGTRTFQKCYLAAHGDQPAFTAWVANESNQRRNRNS